MEIWLPVPLDDPIEEQDVQISFFILNLIKEQFSNIIKTEAEHKVISTKIWKKMVSGTNETCDSCKTYIFNLQYMCESCGYMVCLQCYDKRMPRKIKKSCTHSPRKLLPVEIIAARALRFLQEQLPLHLENFRHSSTEEHNHIIFQAYYNFICFYPFFVCKFYLFSIIRNHGKQDGLSSFQECVWTHPCGHLHFLNFNISESILEHGTYRRYFGLQNCLKKPSIIPYIWYFG